MKVPCWQLYLDYLSSLKSKGLPFYVVSVKDEPVHVSDVRAGWEPFATKWCYLLPTPEALQQGTRVAITEEKVQSYFAALEGKLLHEQGPPPTTLADYVSKANLEEFVCVTVSIGNHGTISIELNAGTEGCRSIHVPSGHVAR